MRYPGHDHNRPSQAIGGFTFIEVILCLVIMGMMGAIWGVGIAHVVDGYNLSRGSTRTVQDAQLALSRITKELSAATGILSGTTTSFQYRSARDNAVHQLTYDSNAGVLYIDSAVLLDQITDFRFSYYDNVMDSPPDPADNTGGFSTATTLVETAFSLSVTGDVEAAFNDTVFLRRLERT